jgi:flagellar hook-basal body complex protein FliE
MVYVSTPNGSDNFYFGGWFTVSGSADNAHFTYVTGNDVIDGAPTTSQGGGTVHWFNCNHLSWTPVTGAFAYYIYGRTGGSFNLIGVTKPQTTVVDATWDDFGATMMGGFVAPYFIPMTAPVSGSPDPLVTTIVAGAGGTSLTLANAATSSVTNSTVLFDNTPNIQTAASHATGGSLLYFPGSANGFVVNSYLTIPAGVAMAFAGGNLVLNATMQIGSADKMFGMLGAQSASFQQFGWPVGGFITVNRANFGVFAASGGGLHIDGIQITGTSNGQYLMVADSNDGSQSHWKNVNFVDGGGAGDYMGVNLLVRGSFWNDLNHIAFLTGPGQEGGGFNGTTATPAALFDTGGLTLSNLSVQDRGIYHIPGASGAHVQMSGISRMQGAIMPFFTLVPSHASGGLLGGTVKISDVELDTMSHAFFAHLRANGTYIGSVILDNLGSGPSGGFAYLTGFPVGFVSGTISGQNSAAINGYNFTNNAVNVTGIGEFMVPIINTTAPSVTVSAGGHVPVGTVCYAITQVDVNGQESTLSPQVCVRVTIGNQKVTITDPAAPAGAVGWLAYRGGSGGAYDRISEHCSITSAPFGTAVIDTTVFSCGHGAPTINRAGSQSMSAAGLSGTGINVTGGGFKNALSFNGTANRKTVLPDLSGSPVSTVGYDSQARKTSAQTPKSLKNPATGITFTVGPNDTLFRADVALACDLSSANATVFLTILYTDVSNTAQTQATTAANCTTLGAASVTAQAFLFMAKAETSIQYSTTIVNKPNYDVRISLQQLGIN